MFPLPPSRDDRLRSRPAIVLLVVCLLGIGSLFPSSVWGQDGEVPPSPRFAEAHWAVGGQALPVPGISLKRAITRRVSVQVAALPGGGLVGFTGGLGGRLLYRIDVQRTRSLFVGGAYSVLFRKVPSPTLDFRSSSRAETAHLQFVAATLGADVVLGAGVSFCVEYGGARVWEERAKESFFFPMLGMGLHYHW